jgi:hypothetical protein
MEFEKNLEKKISDLTFVDFGILLGGINSLQFFN